MEWGEGDKSKGHLGPSRRGDMEESRMNYIEAWLDGFMEVWCADWEYKREKRILRR